MFAKAQPSEPGAEHDHPGFPVVFHSSTLSQLETNLQWFSMGRQMSDASSQNRLRLRITPDAERVLRASHPWIFAESIREQNRPGKTGELAVIYDRQDRFLAIGLFDPDSPIRFRVLQASRPATINRQWFQERLKVALARRADLFDSNTTGYRLINGESDGWPGLVLDQYGPTAVLKLYTAAWIERLAEISALINEALATETIVLRLSRKIPTSPGISDGAILSGRDLRHCDGIILFRETGLVFEADVLRGQKTGFFLDQRENRKEIGRLAKGRTVLNAFSFSGGFSVYAGRGGAKSVTDIDISSHALDAALGNWKRNQPHFPTATAIHEGIQANAFDWLAANRERKFDLIILDPPSLAKREAERSGAIAAYEKLIGLGIEHLSPRGILLACSCSAHVTTEEFYQAARRAGRDSRRRFRILVETGHPPDHPATFKEAHYLKAIYLEFDA